MYPILQPGEKQTSRNAFIVTKDGFKKSVLVETSGGSFSSVMDLNDTEKDYIMRNLPSGAPSLELNLKKIPFSDTDGGFLQAWTYFRAVWDKQKSEAFIWWHYDDLHKKYLMVVPPFYSASAAHLNYPDVGYFCRVCRVGLFDGLRDCCHCGEKGDVTRLQVYGTSHSHGALSAFHSATDHANEMNQTGFHITFGQIDKGPFLAPSFVVRDSNTRFNTDWRHHFAYDLEVEEFAAKYLGLWLDLVTDHTGTGDFRVVVNNMTVFENQSRTVCEAYVRARGEGTVEAKPVIVTTTTSPWTYKAPTIVEHKPEKAKITISSVDVNAAEDIDAEIDELHDTIQVFGMLYVLQLIDSQILDAYEFTDQIVIGTALTASLEKVNVTVAKITYNWSDRIKQMLDAATDETKQEVVKTCMQRLKATELFEDPEDTFGDEDIWNTTAEGRWASP